MIRIVPSIVLLTLIFACTPLEGTIIPDSSRDNGADNDSIKVVAVTAIKLNQTLLIFGESGGEKELVATVEPEGTTCPVVWSSSVDSVAKVSSKGVVTSMATGVALITAKCGDISATCEVIVERDGNIIWFENKRLLQNPLTRLNTPDPTVVKIGNYYYMACTGFPINIYRSSDLANWVFYRTVFDGTNNDPFNAGATDPFNMGSTNLYYWAPSMFVVDDRVYMYVYTIDSVKPRTVSATQLFVSDGIIGLFSWVGTVHQQGMSDTEFRDCQFFKDTNGDCYLATGDGSSSLGRRVAHLQSDLITVSDSWIIDGVDHEGQLLYKHNDWYYLFFSGGSTASYTYNVKCFRSQEITATVWENCGILLEQPDPTNPLNSTGHVGEIMEDRDGKLFMFMHCHCYGLTPNDFTGYGKRYLYCQEIIFDDNDMPHFIDKDGNYTTLPQWQIACPNVQTRDR